MKIGTSKGIETVKLVFKLTGQWPNNLSHLSSKIYNLYFMVILLFLFIYDIPLTIYVFVAENVEEATHTVCLSLAVVILFGKFLNFKIHQSGIQNIMSVAEEFQLETSDEMSLIRRHTLLFDKLTFSLLFFANMSAICMYLGAVFSSNVQLPFLGLYPFDWQCNHAIYVMLFMFQAFGMTIQCNVHVCLDLLPGYMMYMGSIKLEILGERIQKLSEFRQQGQLNVSMDDKTKKRNIESLVKCIAIYQKIWKYIQLTEQYLTYVFLFQFTFSGTLLCSIAYQLTSVSPRENVVLYIFIILFFFSVITQIFIPCYYGNEVILKHENLTGSVFQCGWHLQSMEYRRTVIIFLELIKRRREILIGNWFPLDLNTFTAIANFAYRLYTVFA